MSNQRKPEVSVIIPAYNGARYICECIESVLNQTYRHFEIIVIDDGSTDNTREVLEPYIRNSSIRYFYQDNAGPGAARNFGIKYAQGSYISFCDQDDWYEKDSLEHRLNLYEKHPELGLVCSDFLTAFMTNDYNEVVYGESYVKELNLLERIPNACIETKEKNVYIFNMNVFPEMILAPFVWIGTMMIHKEVFDKVGIFDEKLRWSADTDIQIRISRNYSIGFLNTSTAFYREHGSNMCQSQYSLYNDQIKCHLKFLDPCWGLQESDKRRIRQNLSEWYFRKGRLLIGTKDHFRSMKDFLKGIRYNPLSLSRYRYLLFAALPPKIVSMFRKQKNSKHKRTMVSSFLE